MGLLGVYPVGIDKLNEDDLKVQCSDCLEEKMVTVEFYVGYGLAPHCKCGGKDWYLIFPREG
jgi:hypothetical protein